MMTHMTAVPQSGAANVDVTYLPQLIHRISSFLGAKCAPPPGATTATRIGRTCLGVIVFMCGAYAVEAQPNHEPDWGFVVQLSAAVQESPQQIRLNWEPDPIGVTNGYTIYRKSKTASSWGNPIATLPNDALTYTDTTVAVGTAYEYQVV